MRKILGIILFVCLCAPSFLHAQQATDLSITSIPNNPGPLAPVELEVRSFSIDLTQNVITWRYAGKIIDSGIGKTKITTLAPASGASATITASVGTGVDAPTGGIVLRPASVDLLWEAADSYTPPFYKGKAMPSTTAAIKVTAIPSYTSPKNISYSWSRNGTAQASASGFNKSSIAFQHDMLLSEETIALIISSGSFRGSGEVTITPRDPAIVGYRKSDGFIDYANGSTNSLVANAAGAILRVEPYFFSVPNLVDTDLTVSVMDGDTPVPASIHGNEFAISKPTNGGDTLLNITINTVAYRLQSLKKLFTVSFN